MGKVLVFDHPLIQHKVTLMRKKETNNKEFRELAKEVVTLMGYEATRNLPLMDVEIETPICKTTQKMLKGEDIAIVPILRAGLGFVDGMLALYPNAKVGHGAFYRDPETHMPVEYYCKLRRRISTKERFLWLTRCWQQAVRQSDAINHQARGIGDIIFMCVWGSRRRRASRPCRSTDVDIYIAQQDERLNEHAYHHPDSVTRATDWFGTK